VPVDGGVGGLTGSVSGDINDQRKKKEKTKKDVPQLTVSLFG